MSYPTTLGPWFVVQRLIHENDVILGLEYYQHSDDGEELWVRDPKLALLFMSLQSAARVADSTEAQVRVLTSRDNAKEFGRG